MGEQITNSQSRRRCHCYGPVRAPASWCLGARHRPGSGATSSGAADWPGSRVSALVPARASRLVGRPLARSSPCEDPGPAAPQHRRGLRGRRDAASGPAPGLCARQRGLHLRLLGGRGRWEWARRGPTGLRSRGGRVGTPPLCPLGLPPRPQMTREGAGRRLRRWATPSGDGRGDQWPAGRSGFSFWNAPLRSCSKEWRIKEWEQSGAVFLCY